MKISLNREEYSKSAELLAVKEANISAAEIYIEYLTNHYNDIEFANNSKDFYNLFLNCLEIDEKDEDYERINDNCHLDQISILNKKDYENDAYYKLIKDIRAKEKDWQFITCKYLPFEGFVSDELEINKTNYAEHTPLSYFEEEFVYPAVIENDTIWMSIIPHEINTMKQPIQNANGRVLVLGLGLGYYLFHISNKKEVKSIDVVEIDDRIISLFNKYLLNKFANKTKIHIIHDDAIKYLKSNQKQYDYIFSDIWHNVGDGEMLYLEIKSFENKYLDTKFDYWIETSILAMLRRQTLTVFSEQLEGLKEDVYLKAKNDNDLIINRIYFYLKNTEINNFDVLHNLLSNESLKIMAKNLLDSKDF